MFRIRYFVFWLSIVCAISSSSIAADRWVGPGGNDNASGATRTQRWRTISYAVGNLQVGDRLTILNGTYDLRTEGSDGVANIRRQGNRRLDGWFTNYTVIRAETPRQVFIRGQFDVLGSYIRIEGLRVFGYSDADDPGLEINDSHHIDVFDNEIAFCGGGGINFKHCDAIRVIGNTVHGNAWRNIDQHSGISIFQPIPYDDPEGRHWRIEIRRNSCYDNYNYNPRVYGTTDGNGIILDDYLYQQDQFLEDWHIDRIGNTGYYRGRTLIEGNSCQYNGGTGILCYLTVGIQIKNNTCVGNNQGIFNGDGSYRNRGQILIFDAFGTNVLNNVLQSTFVGAASEYGNAPYTAQQRGGSGNVWQRNLLHSTVAGSDLFDGAGIAQEAVFANPQFVNPQSGNFRAAGGRGLGITWGGGHVYEDFFQKQVVGGDQTDLGAFQF